MLFLKYLDKGLSPWNRFEIKSGTIHDSSKIITPCLQQFLKWGLRIELVETRSCNQWKTEQNWQQIFMQSSCSGIYKYIEELYGIGRRLSYSCLQELL